MKNYVKFVLCGLTAAALLAGCSGSGDKAETTASAPAEEAAEETTAAEIDQGEITKLGDYKGLSVTRMSSVPTEEEVDARIQSIMAANPIHEEVSRPAKNGDVVNIDFVGKKDGEAFDGGTSEGYDLELGSHSFIEGFEEGLIGLKAGDKKDLNLTFPENYGNADLAGQDVVFEVTVNRVEELKDAVLDNAFVQRVSDFDTVEDYREDIRHTLENELKTRAEAMLENDVLEAAVDNSEFDVNPEAVDQIYENQVNYFTMMAQMYGMDLENFITTAYGVAMDQFESDLRDQAELTVKQQLLTDAIAEAENLTLDDDDRQKVADMNNMDLDTMISTYGQEAVDKSAMLYKVVLLIKDNAEIQESEESTESQAAPVGEESVESQEAQESDESQDTQESAASQESQANE